jgi:hypothetical protein
VKINIARLDGASCKHDPAPLFVEPVDIRRLAREIQARGGMALQPPWLRARGPRWAWPIWSNLP